LDIRTKHTIAQDRFVVAEQRILDAERRKSATNIQLLTFEQKKLEKKLAKLYSNFNSTVTNRPLKIRGRSTSEIIFRNIRRSSSWTETLPINRPKLAFTFHDSNQNLLSLPKIADIERRFSAFSEGDIPENPFNIDSEEEEKSKSNLQIPSPKKLPIKKKKTTIVGNKQTQPLLPIVAVIPPEDEEVLFLTRENLL
jgi:hypothetical protein